MSEVLANVTCVALGGRGILIQGPPGSGKSSLALALIDRGAALVGDDGITLQWRESGLVAAPPPNIRGKLEIRNVGLVDLPAVAAPVALVLRLDPAAPRFIQQAEQAEICGHAVPLVRLFPDSAVLALRAEWALHRHGIA